MLNWHEPSTEEINQIYNAATQLNSKGNDCSYTNIILYKEKLNTQIAFYDDVLFRKMKDVFGKEYYMFPLGSKNKLTQAIQIIIQDAKEQNKELNFALISSKQKILLEELLPKTFEFIENRNESDYLYLSDDLAFLPGAKYHKKRNHIAKFNKKYSNTKFKPLSQENKNDFLAIADKWFLENGGCEDSNKIYENKIIHKVIEASEIFNLYGGILYVENIPIAMSLASAINNTTVDIHFEKAISEYAKNGAYAVINQEFAKALSQTFKYINREEDLGIEGLRKAKLSYYPAKILEKWTAIKSHKN